MTHIGPLGVVYFPCLGRPTLSTEAHVTQLQPATFLIENKLAAVLASLFLVRNQTKGAKGAALHIFQILTGTWMPNQSCHQNIKVSINHVVSILPFLTFGCSRWGVTSLHVQHGYIQHRCRFCEIDFNWQLVHMPFGWLCILRVLRWFIFVWPLFVCPLPRILRVFTNKHLTQVQPSYESCPEPETLSASVKNSQHNISHQHVGSSTCIPVDSH